MKIEDIQVGKRYFIRWGGSSAIRKEVVGKSETEIVFEWLDGSFSAINAEDVVCEDTRPLKKPRWAHWWA